VINGGDVSITESYEGIETAASDMTINGGTIHVVASDDGLNVPGRSQYLYINGGFVVIHANGDGIDGNGSIAMSDGRVVVNATLVRGTAPLDYDRGEFQMTGGFLAGAGGSTMAQGPGALSSQYAVLVYFQSSLKAGTIVRVESSSGEDILTFAPSASFDFLTFSTSALTTGVEYSVYVGGTSTGTVTDGFYEGGTYEGGTLIANFEITSVVTTVVP